MELKAYLAQLARYHVWATHRLLADNLAPLSDDEWHREMGLFFGSVHRTVNHLLVTDDIWYERLVNGVSLRLPLDTELHPDRGAVVTALTAAVERWPLWADTMDPGRLGEELVYTRSSGEVVRMPYALAVGHSFNHATHHRGQMTAAVTALGHLGPALDWTLLLQSQTGSNHERIQHPRTSA